MMGTPAQHGRWLVLLLLWLCATVSASSIIPTAASSSFPQCGLSCTLLTQAQDSCMSGAASSWVSCFCQSALLTSLKSSGSLCTSCTASADQSLLSTWYNNYCNSGGTDTGASTTTTSSSSSTTSTSTATAAVTAGKSTTNSSTTDEKKSWWSAHYQWVIMLIVLAIGFSALAAGGVWLKRRYDAKRPGLYHGGSAMGSSSGVLRRNSNSGVLSPPSAAWASPAVPGQSQSLASSSRTEVALQGNPALPPGSRTRLQKPTQSAADVEIRQISRQ
ncbi:uncharacterized protein N7482_003209 [Penicillium canariense]|uniref:Integral membrane protein n=1 Tax=Penicillium canariense TaxID=189055 RepID=A0A9W9I6S1_9EURO|nr:uncharacterized protein N7482_003209 [Penicillium canariense]KAJ5167615.1 hypothetical protein N7482_003209 [Penicillium canariense]